MMTSNTIITIGEVVTGRSKISDINEQHVPIDDEQGAARLRWKFGGVFAGIELRRTEGKRFGRPTPNWKNEAARP